MKFLLLALAILTFQSLFAQGSYDQEWHFGQGISVNFQGGYASLGMSSIFAEEDIQPASICDEDGALIGYTDGNNIYNASGEVVINGNFDQVARESIFSPIPDQSYKYFLFRSSIAFGVSWTIIDFAEAGGQGQIIDIEKEQVFHEHVSELMISPQSEENYFWLIIADNNSGIEDLIQFKTFSIESQELVEIDSFSSYYQNAGNDDHLEDARISPTCDQIATSHYGHSITLFEFDTNNGQVESIFPLTAGVASSGTIPNYIEYSASGDYLYVLIDREKVFRYETWQTYSWPFINSQEELEIDDMDYSHIKRGSNGKIYLLDQFGMRIDMIDYTDSEEPILLMNEVVQNSPAEFFPNTVQECQSPLSFSEFIQSQAVISPNPNFGDFSVELPYEEILSLSIYDINGRDLSHILVNTEQTNDFQRYSCTAGAGTYILIARTLSGETIAQRLIIL